MTAANIALATIKVVPIARLADSEDKLRFADLAGIQSMIETDPLEQAAQAYARMMSGGAKFRVVLTT